MLSVDFGALNTSAAFRDRNGVTNQIPLSSNRSSMPSAVLYTQGWRLVPGEEAVQAAATDPLAFEPSPKRRMNEHEALLAEKFVPVSDLVAAVLAEVLKRAVEVAGDEAQPGTVVLTHPDHWGPSLQQQLATAGEVAGIDLPDIRLVGEATAAAAYYTATGADFPADTRLAVIDIGASTCNVAVLDKRSDGSFAVVAADGFDGLGGLDFDARVHAWVMGQLHATKPALAAEVTDAKNAAARLRLAECIRGAKEALSSADSAVVEVSGAAVSEALTLTRDQFEQLIGADVDRAVRLAESLVYQANLARHSDDSVIVHLIGGSSRVPLIQSRLGALGPVHVPADPKAVLTCGALSATPPPQQWKSIKLPDLPVPEAGSKKWRRKRGAAPSGPEQSRRRIRVTKTVKRWSAGVALLAMLASGVGVAAMMIFGAMSTPKQSPQVATPRTTLAPPAPKMPTAAEFTVNVVVTEQQCPPQAPTCAYKYTIEPKYIGMHPLPETPFTVAYEVVGGIAPQRGEFTVEKEQARILKDVALEGPPAAQLKANVVQVTEGVPPPPGPPPQEPPPGR